MSFSYSFWQQSATTSYDEELHRREEASVAIHVRRSLASAASPARQRLPPPHYIYVRSYRHLPSQHRTPPPHLLNHTHLLLLPQPSRKLLSPRATTYAAFNPVVYYYPYYYPAHLLAMPGKHVHFVDGPSTPSSTFSASTLSSSSGPATPPPVWYSPPQASAKSSHSSPRLAAAHAHAHYQIHPLLAAAPDGGLPALSWDLSLPAESSRAQLPPHPAQLTDTLVSAPATSPPLASLAIICAHLPWTITVTPTRGASWAAPYVTVGDVLHTLFRTLRLGVTEPELGAGVLDAPARDRVHDAYVRRYRRVVDGRERDAEKAKGVKRVDFLRDQRMFGGLSLVQGGLPAKRVPHGAVWVLHTAKP